MYKLLDFLLSLSHQTLCASPFKKSKLKRTSGTRQSSVPDVRLCTLFWGIESNRGTCHIPFTSYIFPLTSPAISLQTSAISLLTSYIFPLTSPALSLQTSAISHQPYSIPSRCRISSISAGVTTMGFFGKCFVLPVTR